MYVYEKTEAHLYTVGFYDPDGRWHPDSDHDTRTEAGDRGAYLNGSAPATPLAEAAPDLLVACQKFVSIRRATNQREKLDMVFRMAEKAIEKAGAEIPRPNLLKYDYQHLDIPALVEKLKQAHPEHFEDVLIAYLMLTK